MKNELSNAIIIFTKYPRKGEVKTRLAKTIGDDLAINFYKICSEYIFNECVKLNNDSTAAYLFYSNKNDEEKVREWIGSGFIFIPQEGIDLGEKMMNAFETVFKNNLEKVIIIGTDIPGINYDLLEEAFNILDIYDTVLGPSTDGGYYLLGMKKFNKNLFNNIKWSSSFVLNETVEKLKKEKLSFKLQPLLIDIDTYDNFREWITKSEDNHPVKEWFSSSFSTSFKKDQLA